MELKLFMVQVEQGVVELPVAEGINVGALTGIIQKAVTPYECSVRELSDDDINEYLDYKVEKYNKDEETKDTGAVVNP